MELYSLFGAVVYIAICAGYNIDLKNPYVFTPSSVINIDTSWFGYSISLFKQHGHVSLIVGAPQANASALQRTNGAVYNSGTIYQCEITDEQPACTEIPVSNLLNNIAYLDGEFVPKEEKSGQWLGATLATDSSTGLIVTCAPRFVTKSPSADLHNPTGTCYYTKNLTGSPWFIELSPCKDDFEKFYREEYPNKYEKDKGVHLGTTSHGMCGFSVDIASHDDIAIGAVGAHFWQGKLYSMSSGDYQKTQSWPESSPYKTFNSTKAITGRNVPNDDTYKSWAVKYMDLDGDDSTVTYAASIPRENMLKGMISFWRYKYNSPAYLENLGRGINGDQAGSYFGYALAVGDFNGDGIDDLAASAPLWTDYKHDIIEIGKVYIYLQVKEFNVGGGASYKWNDIDTILMGESVKGRFGLSVEYLGDLNHDRYGDLAVGAPYAGPNNRGAVYIYNGGKDGIGTKYSQVVYSEDVSQAPPILTFGWSITGGEDIDQNQYHDMAIGAYKSDMAVLLRTRSLIQVTGQIKVTPDNVKLSVPCKVLDTEINTEFEIEFCSNYSVLQSPDRVTLKVRLEIDAKNNFTRRAFERNSERSSFVREITLNRNQRKCFVIDAYVNPDIRDKTSNIIIEAHWELTSADSGIVPPPMIDELMGTSVSYNDLYFAKSCTTCEPNLLVRAESLNEHYILDSDDPIDLKVKVENHGQDSYLTYLNISLPAGVEYVPSSHVAQCITISCLQITPDNADPYISCDIGNPFPENQLVEFMVKLRLTNITQIDYSELKFALSISSQFAADTDISNNEFELNIPLKVVTSISVTGISDPPDAVIYNRTHLVENNKLGPHVSHQFEVYTSGPSKISDSELIIQWPMYSTTGDYFLYLYRQPETTQGDASCDLHPEFINPEYLTSHTLGEISRQKRALSPIIQNLTECNNGISRCVTITCTIHSLSKELSVIVKVYSLLWMSEAFKNLTQNYTKEIIISSTATAKVTDVPYFIKPDTYPQKEFTLPSYLEKYRPTEVIKPIDLKWILIGIGIGLLLLLIIIIVLWRCSFFKRYRPYERVKVEKHSEDDEPNESDRLYSAHNS